jgi:molybdopterin-guanine dinucleotide biosynthesis protein B
MKVIAIVGRSGSGKTRLISRLVPELRKRGLSVGVIKHCSRGFDLGGPEKDSSIYFAAGADGVGLASPGRWAVIRRGKPEPSFRALARKAFREMDIVLVEGGRRDPGLKKIEVIGPGKARRPESRPRELAAVVAGNRLHCGVPVFHPDHIAEIAAWLEGEG